MKDNDKKHKQHISELQESHQSIAVLKRSNSELKQVEKELYKSEEKLNKLLENINDVVFQISPLGIIEYVSPKVKELYGYKPEELVGKHLKKTTPKSEIPKALKVLKTALSGKTVKNFEVDQRDRDGNIVHMEINGMPVKKNGTVIAVQGVMRDITERKRATDTLKETSLFLRNILDSSSSISIVFTDLEQNILFWNKGAENIFGYKAEEVVGRHTVDILYPNDVKDIKQTVAEIRSFIVNKKRGIRRELKEVTKDGRTLWISLTSTPRLDENGNVVGILGIGEDITERKQAEEMLQKAHQELERRVDERTAKLSKTNVLLRQEITERKRMEKELRESEEELEAVFNDVKNGIIQLDLTGKILKINKRIIETTGYTEKDIVGKRFKLLKMFTADSIKKMIVAFAKTIAGQHPPPYEVEAYIKTGEKRIAEIHSSQLIKGGKIVGAVAVIKDITERKQVEEELRKSEERFRKVVETMKVGLAACDENGILTYVNDYSSSMIGYSVDEMVGHDPTDFYYDEEGRKAQKEIFEKRRKGMRDAPTREIAWRTKDGRKVYSILSPTPMFDAEGRYQGSFAIHTDITERKVAEKALRESEERYRALYEDNPSMYFTVDTEGTVLSVNQFGAEQLGYTIQELVGQPVFNVFYKDDKEVVKKHVTACIQHPSEVFHWELRKVRKNGNIMWVKETARTVRCSDGDPVVLIVCEDITERKRMEEALRQSETNLKKAQEVGHIGSWHLNLKKNELIWSDEACRIFGVPQGTVLTYEEFLEMVHPYDREGVNKAWLTALDDKELYDIEHRIVVNDEVKWIRERAEVEFNDRNKGIRATGTVQDITDLKQAEEKLRESKERYRSLVESSTDAIMMLDHDENVITCNQAFLDLFGYQEEEIVGKAIRIIHPSDESAQKFREAHYQTLEKSGSVRAEWDYMRKDGTSFPAELVISLISSPEGTIIGCISIIRDITERKRADERLKANFDTLSKSLESTVSALASAFEVRDPYTAGHQQRVTDLACAIAEDMGLGVEQIAGIRMAGLIHDIGKINIPAEILNKPGHLSELEYSLFKNHPQVGHDVLKPIEFPWPVAQIVLQHHERFDGSGYPQGLTGKEILLEARILAVADIVEAIASHRPYRPARGIGDALEEVLHNKGTLYDPDVVDTCLRVFYEKGFTFEELAKVEAPLPKIH